MVWPVAADMVTWNDGSVTVGSETKHVCSVTVHTVNKIGLATPILLPAGFSPKHKAMMNLAMRKSIANQSRGIVSSMNLVMLEAKEFTTAGEAQAVAWQLLKTDEDGGKARVIVVVRWWHAPRARAILRHFLNYYGMGPEQVAIETRPVWSWDIVGCCGEPFACIKNGRRSMKRELDGGYKY